MNKLKEMREETGLTQQAFSDLLNIPKRTLQDWEGDKRQPPDYVVSLIQYYLEHENFIKKLGNGN